jgi:iron complex outermembrane receptor protein
MKATVRVILGASASIASLSTGTAHAQGAPAAPPPAPPATTAEEDRLGDIVVTAQRREERLQDVPIAVTALTAEDLVNSRIESTQDLEEKVSSLTFTQSTNEQNSNLRIRGVGTALFGTGFEPSVSIVLDGVVLARQGQGFVDLVDLERVEVLRGPQGTLFGKNASAGVLNITTRRPSRELEFFGDVTVAERDEYRVRGSVSGPLGANMGARLTGFYTDVGGHILNRATDRFINGVKSHGVRGQFEWDATPDLNLLLIGDYRKSTSTCCQYQSRFVGNPVLLQALRPVVPSVNNKEVNVDGPVGGGTEQYGASLQARYDLGFASLVSISAYRTWDFSNNQDVDGTNNPIPGARNHPAQPQRWHHRHQADQPGAAAGFGRGRSDRLHRRPLLFRARHRPLLRPPDRRLHSQCAAAAQPEYRLAPGAGLPSADLHLVRLHLGNRSVHYAAFGQVTWNITKQLSLIGGLRYQYEKQDAEGNRPGNALFPGDLDLIPTTPNTPFRPTSTRSAPCSRARVRRRWTTLS